MAKKTTPKTEPVEEAVENPTYLGAPYNLDTLRYLANEVNRIHGSGPQCAIAFEEINLTPLAGVVAATAVIEGYFTIPSRDRWDGQYTAEEIGEILS